MKFTVVFPSHESQDLSFGVVFIPCICWVRGDRVLQNPHRNAPHYRKGDLQCFFQETGVSRSLDKSHKKVVVLAHQIGDGTEKDLELLQEDLWEAGFEPTLVRI